MHSYKRIEIIQRLYKQSKNTEIELIYTSPFELLISLILSAKTRDNIVNKVTAKLFTVANTPESITNLGITQLMEYIKNIIFFKKKAKYIINTSTIILEVYNSIIPRNRKDLESLPGVGRKTANFILNTIFFKSTVAVDTHVFRVSNRTGLAYGNTTLQVEKQIMKLIPKMYLFYINTLLVGHGRYTCTAKKQKCYVCNIEDLCMYKLKNF